MGRARAPPAGPTRDARMSRGGAAPTRARPFHTVIRARSGWGAGPGRAGAVQRQGIPSSFRINFDAGIAQRRPAETAAARVASGNARVLKAMRDGTLLPSALAGLM